jgi:hypothetical protein
MENENQPSGPSFLPDPDSRSFASRPMDAHRIVKLRYLSACGALEKRGNEGMNEAGGRRHEQRAGKPQGRPLMFEIAFSDRMRVIQKPALQHIDFPGCHIILLAES